MQTIPNLNLFMMCEVLNSQALSALPDQFHIRSCQPAELDLWKAMPFDDPLLAKEYEGFMTDYFTTTYAGKEELFFDRTQFVCDQANNPVATALLWQAYDAINTLQWFKVVKAYEGQGIGRALLSSILKNLSPTDFPIYLHTQPSSYRAIKLYSDFGFCLLASHKVGSRSNDLTACLPILKRYMPKGAYDRLRVVPAPSQFEQLLANQRTIQF